MNEEKYSTVLAAYRQVKPPLCLWSADTSGVLGAAGDSRMAVMTHNATNRSGYSAARGRLTPATDRRAEASRPKEHAAAEASVRPARRRYAQLAITDLGAEPNERSRTTKMTEQTIENDADRASTQRAPLRAGDQGGTQFAAVAARHTTTGDEARQPSVNVGFQSVRGKDVRA